MGKKAKPGVPRSGPKYRRPVTKGDLEDVFSRLASAPPVATRENREPTREELNRRYRLVRLDG